jgi:hypothetical protein
VTTARTVQVAQIRETWLVIDDGPPVDHPAAADPLVPRLALITYIRTIDHGDTGPAPQPWVVDSIAVGDDPDAEECPLAWMVDGDSADLEAAPDWLRELADEHRPSTRTGNLDVGAPVVPTVTPRGGRTPLGTTAPPHPTRRQSQ